jgi:hypothetical protein
MTAKITNKPIIPSETSNEQTVHLNELLGANESYFSKEFITSSLFRLPFDIKYCDSRAYLSIGPLGIEYTSLTQEYKVNIVFATTTIPNRDLCDCLIDTLEFFRKYKDNIEIIESPDDCIIEK